MNFVEPIRDLKKITQIKNTLKGAGKVRDLLLFELGINSALRPSDLLSIKINDVYDKNLNIKDYFDIKESKTNKKNRVPITPKVKTTLNLYKKTFSKIIENHNNYLFFNNKKMPLGHFAIGRKQVWVMIKEWCKNAGLNGEYGGHTLRKTWGYQARLQNVPLELIQYKLNHSSMSITKRYLGITDDEIKEACNKLDL